MNKNRRIVCGGEFVSQLEQFGKTLQNSSTKWRQLHLKARRKMDVEMGAGGGAWKRSPEDNNGKSLYEAALLGSVDILDTLLERDPLILDRVSLSSSPQTPLHVAALRGHLEFTKVILKYRPELAAELDAEKCSALHLAAANGHAEVVKLLLEAYPGARSVRDRDGRTPLHLAAMRGRAEVIKELISFRPLDDSLQQGLEGDSVLHLCVKYNHLDALKVLVDLLADDNADKLLNSVDAHGNTILDLAVLLKQEETARFLLSVCKVREGSASSTLLGNNSIAPDVSYPSPWNFKSVGISRYAITEASANRSSNKIATANPPNGYGGELELMSGFCDKWIGPLANYPGNWIDETRGSLMTVATLIAAITFDPVLSPPGGVWQEDTDSGTTCSELKGRNITCLAGNAVAAYYDQQGYNAFMICNTIAFMGSLSVLFLLISGFPPKNRFCLRLLTAIVFITVTFLGFSFIQAMILVTPDQVLHLHKLRLMIIGSISTWATLVGFVGIVNAVLLIYLILRWSQRRSSTGSAAA